MKTLEELKEEYVERGDLGDLLVKYQPSSQFNPSPWEEVLEQNDRERDDIAHLIVAIVTTEN